MGEGLQKHAHIQKAEFVSERNIGKPHHQFSLKLYPRPRSQSRLCRLLESFSVCGLNIYIFPRTPYTMVYTTHTMLWKETQLSVQWLNYSLALFSQTSLSNQKHCSRARVKDRPNNNPLSSTAAGGCLFPYFCDFSGSWHGLCVPLDIHSVCIYTQSKREIFAPGKPLKNNRKTIKTKLKKESRTYSACVFFSPPLLAQIKHSGFLTPHHGLVYLTTNKKLSDWSRTPNK